MTDDGPRYSGSNSIKSESRRGRREEGVPSSSCCCCCWAVPLPWEPLALGCWWMEELLDGVEADVEVEVAVELAVEVGDVAPSQFKESQVTNPKI